MGCWPIASVEFSYLLHVSIYLYINGIAGMETIQERRGLKTDKPVLLNGPGKVRDSQCRLHFICSSIDKKKVESVSDD